MNAEVKSRVHGWRMKIGYINPTTCDYPNNWTKMIPEGVKMIATSSGAGSFDRSNMGKARDGRRAAAQLLDEWGVDCIIAGGGPVSTLEGREAEEQFITKAREELSVPFTTALGAQIDALRAIEVDSLLAVTPFPDERDEETKTYLEAHGFDVIAIGGVSVPKPSDVRNLEPSTAYQCAKRMATQVTEEFDAIYVGCAPFGPVEYINRIEEDTGYPVIMSAQAQAWKAFQFGGIHLETDELGALFSITR